MLLRHSLMAFVLLHSIGCDRAAQPPQKNETPPITEAKPKDVESTMVKDQWPFDDAENTAVITLTRIMNGSQPILYVVHDEDGDWQFLDGGDVSEEDAATVSLKNIANHDPSVKLLADLPAGWAAERDAVGKEWQRFQR